MDGQDVGRKRRLSAARKRDLVLSLLKGADAAELGRKQGVSQAELFRWRDRFLEAGQEGLKSRREEQASGYEREIRRLQRVVGKLTLEAEILKEAAKLKKKGCARID
jgi:putative transposase